MIQNQLAVTHHHLSSFTFNCNLAYHMPVIYLRRRRTKTRRTRTRNRMLDLWKARNTNEELDKVGEQRLADQVRQIKTKKWLENVEQEEIALRVTSGD